MVRTHDLGEANDRRFVTMEYVDGVSGALLYECLTGRPPFTELSPPAQLARLLRGDVAPAHQVNPEVPLPLSELVRATLATDRRERPATATELHDALARLGASAPELAAGNELAY